MAEYVKLRLAAARLGVTMALMGLIAGVADRARAATGGQRARSDAALPSGGSAGLIAIHKLEDALATLEHKLATSYFTTGKVYSTFLKISDANAKFLKIDAADTTFLKIDAADTTFLKIADANASYLKLDDANANFLKLDAANATFLKISDANTTFQKVTDANATFLKITDAANQFLKISDAAAQYLKVGATAANANQLGGLTAGQFVQGGGSTAAAGILIGLNQPSATVVSSPDGLLSASVSANVDQVVLTVHNASAQLLPAVITVDGSVKPSGDLKAGGDTTFTVTGSQSPHQFELQTFGDGSVRKAVTLILSTEPSATTQGSLNVVGQMLIGLL